MLFRSGRVVIPPDLDMAERLRQVLKGMGETAPLVVASAMPCPCGWHGRTEIACACPASAIERERARIIQCSRSVGADFVILDVPWVARVDMATPAMRSADIRREISGTP